MKTSNKLLITLAALFFAVPLAAMIYHRGDFVDAKDYKAPAPEAVKVFKDELKDYTPKALTAFSTVAVLGDGKADISIEFIQDTQYGIKIAEKSKDGVEASVNANGELQINVKDNANARSIGIKIYAPLLGNLAVAKVDNLDLYAKTDSVNVSVSDVANFNMNSDHLYNSLTVSADKADLGFWNINAKQLNITLKDSKFRTNGKDFPGLSITASGKSEVEIEAGREDTKPVTINNLVLHAGGTTLLKMERIMAGSVSGSITDSVSVNMPVPVLRQLLK